MQLKLRRRIVTERRGSMRKDVVFEQLCAEWELVWRFRVPLDAIFSCEPVVHETTRLIICFQKPRLTTLSELGQSQTRGCWADAVLTKLSWSDALNHVKKKQKPYRHLLSGEMCKTYANPNSLRPNSTLAYGIVSSFHHCAPLVQNFA